MLREIVIETNKRVSILLGINQSSATTSIKPSASEALLVNSSPGIRPRWAPYYVRNIRISAYSPIYRVFKKSGVPMNPENGQLSESANTWVVPFPVKSPEKSVCNLSLTAIEQCTYWLRLKQYFTEHNASITILYDRSELDDIINWIWKNQDYVTAMAFLPKANSKYEQMPYVSISKEEYLFRKKNFPTVDFSELYQEVKYN